MAKLFAGLVELSETPTPGSEALFVGTTLCFRFQARKCTADVSEGRFPAINVRASGVDTLQDWQQHEVRLNGVLVGTIEKRDSSSPDEAVLFSFPFQPRVLRLDEREDYYNMPLDRVNELTVTLCAGGFGLEDSFTVSEIEITETVLHFSLV